MTAALVALVAMLGTCPDPVTVKVTGPEEVRLYVPREGFAFWDTPGLGRVIVGADSVAVVCR